MTDGSRVGAIGIDIGGTTVKAVLVDHGGGVLARIVRPTPQDGDAVFQVVVEVVAGLFGELEAAGLALGGIGIASPGLVDARTGVVRFAANLGWADLPLAEELSRRFGVPVSVDNDARTGALAEVASTGLDDIVFVPIGTGVSAAVRVNGDFIVGATDSAGEFGHVRALEGGDACSCGSRGCLEAYASASSIVARYHRLGGSSADSASGVEALIDSDPIARTVWDDAVAALVTGLVTIVALVDPVRIVIGGGLSLAGETLLGPVRAGVASRLTWRAAPSIEASALGADSALLGAALLGLRVPPPRARELVVPLREGIAEQRAPLS